MFNSSFVHRSGKVFFAPSFGVDPVRLVFLPIRHATCTRNHKGHGRHPPVSCRGFASCQRCTALYLASMSVPVGIGLHRWPLTQACRGVELTRVLIRNGDHSASGIAPLAVQDRMAGVLAIRELPTCARSLAACAVRRRCLTRVPREANASDACGSARSDQDRTHSRTENGRKPKATATGVGRLAAPARRKRSQRRRLEDGYYSC